MKLLNYLIYAYFLTVISGIGAISYVLTNPELRKYNEETIYNTSPYGICSSSKIRGL